MTGEGNALSKRGFHRLLERGNFAFIEWLAEEPWTLRYASPSCEGVLGWGVDQLMQPSFGFRSLVHTDDWERVASVVQEALGRGAREIIHEHYRILRSDGQLLCLADHTFVEPVGDGSFVLCCCLHDVTEERERQLQLEEKEERFRLVLEGTRLGIWDWNPQTNAVTFDERWAHMLGYRLEEIPFHVESWSSRVHPDDVGACFADLERHISGKTDFYENVHRMRHKDGSWRYILDRGRIVARDAQGKATRFTGTHTDITEQKAAEVAAREASRLKTLFLATMSHEIRTPLNGVLGLLQLIEETALPVDQQRYLRLIRSSSESLLTIISDLLDVSKLEQHAIELESHDFFFERAVEASIELFRPRAVEKRIDLRWQREGDEVGWVRADSHRLQQILTNVVSNAIKFTSQGEVVVTTRSEGDAQVVEVRDSGAGMSDTTKIWQPFRQESAGTARRFGGTGLGLTIVRELVRLMNGEIDVESKLDQGSRFTLRFLFPPAAPPASGRDPVPSSHHSSSLKVLIAEDNHVNQVVALGVLRRLGVEPELVTDGQAAVEAARARDFDVILMDLHMPVLDGIDATRLIRALPGDHRPRIIAISADALGEHREAAFAAGIDAYISKPFRVAQLREQLFGTDAV